MFDIKNLLLPFETISESRQIPKEILWTIIESAFASAYKKEYAKNDQIIKAKLNIETGKLAFMQVKLIVTEDDILSDGEEKTDLEDKRVKFNPERHILLSNALLVNSKAEKGEELFFELESKTEFSRIAAQAAKQTILQKLSESEREIVVNKFKDKEGIIVNGVVRRMERGKIFVDLGRVVATLPFAEQIRTDRFKIEDNIMVYIKSVDLNRKDGDFIQLSRRDPNFIIKLFEREVPELTEGTIVVRGIVRDPGLRTKIAIESKDPTVDVIGSFVGPRGIRVFAVKNELRGEQIDIIEWGEKDEEFLEESLSPAEISGVEFINGEAFVTVSDSQIALTIGKSAQNLKLASELTNKTIYLIDLEGERIARATPTGDFEFLRERPEIQKNPDEEENENEETSQSEDKEEPQEQKENANVQLEDNSEEQLQEENVPTLAEEKENTSEQDTAKEDDKENKPPVCPIS